MNRCWTALTAVPAILMLSQPLGGCAYQPVSPTPDAIRGSISAGDTVRVTTQSGEEQTFRVVEVRADRLSGEDADVAYAQIARLEKQEINKPVLWTVIGIGVAGLAGGSSGGSGY